MPILSIGAAHAQDRVRLKWGPPELDQIEVDDVFSELSILAGVSTARADADAVGIRREKQRTS